MTKKSDYQICAGWLQDETIGTLSIEQMRGKEVCSFSYDPEWLSAHAGLFLDPELMPYEGRQYAANGLFHFLGDAAPDRWGRRLIDKKENWLAGQENRHAEALNESAYLLRITDRGRTGGIRIYDGTRYIAADGMEIPPLARLRMLQDAAWAFEKNDSDFGKRWLNQIFSPGSSLGGARPKANVRDEEGALWIAKFPSVKDEWHTESWEAVIHDLAELCGLHVPEACLETAGEKDIFLIKRFDRVQEKRIHFASAMTMTGMQDGDEAGFLDIAASISTYGCQPEQDLAELWRRMTFSVITANTDCHLRNHGFLLTPAGWRLAPMYDVNPNPLGRYMALALSERSNERSLPLTVQTAGYYGISHPKEEIEKMQTCVHDNLKNLCSKYRIEPSERKMMSQVFLLDQMD